MDGNGAIWIIFIAMLLVMIVFFIYSAIKDRKAKNKKRKDNIIYEQQSIEMRRDVVFKVNAIVKYNNQYLQEFTPSIGEFKMSQLVETTRELLDQMRNHRTFKEYVADNIHLQDINAHFSNLINNRSKNWEKNNSEDLAFFAKEFSEFDPELYESELAEIDKTTKEFYENKMKQN